jgi:hypothetical protein
MVKDVRMKMSWRGTRVQAAIVGAFGIAAAYIIGKTVYDIGHIDGKRKARLEMAGERKE